MAPEKGRRLVKCKQDYCQTRAYIYRKGKWLCEGCLTAMLEEYKAKLLLQHQG